MDILNSNEVEKFLVEELESLFATEVVLYSEKLFSEWDTTIFDPLYYNRLLSGKVFWQFCKFIYKRVENLNKFEATRYFALSIAQFQSHTPESRLEAYSAKFHEANLLLNKEATSITNLSVATIKQSWFFYRHNFALYKSTVEYAFEEYKTGVLSIQPSTNNSLNNTNKQIHRENFMELYTMLLSNDIYATSPLDYNTKIRICLNNSKSDIIENLLELSADDRKPYLNSLIFKMAEFKKTSYITFDDILNCLNKYNIKLPKNDYCLMYEKNQLHKILSCVPMQVNNKFSGSYSKKWYEIQSLYFRYYYGLYLNDIVTFIEIQMTELNPSLQSPQPPIQNPIPIPHKKLKVNITVPQLTFLFKMLNDLKPDIFDIASKKELSNFIADNFITKATEKEGIKEGSVYNHLTDTDKSTAIFWSEKLSKMIQEARHV